LRYYALFGKIIYYIFTIYCKDFLEKI